MGAGFVAYIQVCTYLSHPFKRFQTKDVYLNGFMIPPFMIQVPSTSNFTIALTIGDKYGKARLYLGFALLDERRCRPVSNDYMPLRFIRFSSMTTPSSVISYVQPLHINQTQLTFAWFYVMLEEKSKCQW